MMAKGPILIELDASEAPAVTEVPPVPDVTEDGSAPQGRAMNQAFRFVGKKPSWLARAFWAVAGALLTAIISAAAWKWVTDWIAASPRVGWIFAGLLAAFLGLVADHGRAGIGGAVAFGADRRSASRGGHGPGSRGSGSGTTRVRPCAGAISRARGHEMGPGSICISGAGPTGCRSASRAGGTGADGSTGRGCIARGRGCCSAGRDGHGAGASCSCGRCGGFDREFADDPARFGNLWWPVRDAWRLASDARGDRASGCNGRGRSGGRYARAGSGGRIAGQTLATVWRRSGEWRADGPCWCRGHGGVSAIAVSRDRATESAKSGQGCLGRAVFPRGHQLIFLIGARTNSPLLPPFIVWRFGEELINGTKLVAKHLKHFVSTQIACLPPRLWFDLENLSSRVFVLSNPARHLPKLL